jgi:hypothetical protein
VTAALAALRKLVLGETWAVPVGVALSVGVAAVLSAASPGWWDSAGGFVLLGGALATFVVALRRGLPPR